MENNLRCAFIVVTYRQPDNTFIPLKIAVQELGDNEEFKYDDGTPLFGEGTTTSMVDIDGQYVIIIMMNGMYYNRIKIYLNEQTIDDVPELGVKLHCGISDFNLASDKSETKLQNQNIAKVIYAITGLAFTIPD